MARDVNIREGLGWRGVTLIIAVVGAVTGIAGLVLGLEARREERAISLSGHASVTTSDSNHGLQIVRLSIANGGIRGVVIQDASIWTHGRRVASTLGYIPDFESIYQTISPGERPLRRQPLPFPLPDRQAAVIGLVMEPVFQQSPTYSPPVFGAMLFANDNRYTKRVRAEQAAERCCAKDSLIVAGAWLRVTTVPGSTKDFPIEQRLVQTNEPRYYEPFDVKIDAPPGRDATLALSGYPGRLGATMLAMRIWSATSPQPAATVERPLNKYTSLPLGRPLPAGKYEVAFMAGGQVLFEGVFHTPCVRPLGERPFPHKQRCGAVFYRPFTPHIDE
jgi:hypothetical protein